MASVLIAITGLPMLGIIAWFDELARREHLAGPDVIVPFAIATAARI